MRNVCGKHRQGRVGQYRRQTDDHAAFFERRNPPEKHRRLKSAGGVGRAHQKGGHTCQIDRPACPIVRISRTGSSNSEQNEGEAPLGGIPLEILVKQVGRHSNKPSKEEQGTLHRLQSQIGQGPRAAQKARLKKPDLVHHRACANKAVGNKAPARFGRSIHPHTPSPHDESRHHLSIGLPRPEQKAPNQAQNPVSPFGGHAPTVQYPRRPTRRSPLRRNNGARLARHARQEVQGQPA